MTRIAKCLAVTLLPILLVSCGDEIKLADNFSVQVDAKKNSIKNGGELTINTIAKKEMPIDSVVYALDGKMLGGKNDLSPFTTSISVDKLGQHKLSTTVYTDEGSTVLTQKLNVLHTQAPKVYGYRIVNRFPHKTDAYTQGLEFVGDTLYESNGEYGASSLRKLDYKTGEVLKEISINDKYFAEGMTVLGNNIYQLTWKNDIGFIYNKDSFEKIGTFSYKNSPEGWGLTNDGTTIYKSDGTSKIWILDGKNLAERSYIEPTHNKGVMSALNELEWVDGKIYANTYQRPSIAIINPNTGALEGLVDLTTLRDQVQSGLDPVNEVLNGIAYKANENRLFVTGKHWNTLFEIEIFEK